jgi:glutamate N-acetyltransferase / amino-acid N-acetyltransferase
MDNLTFIDGSINTPEGFKACGIHCGIKKNDEKDLAVIFCDVPAIANGVFTKNLVKGHSLLRTKNLLQDKKIQAIIINSGNANACVGQQGDKDAELMAETLSAVLNIESDCIMTGSTGVIGKPLPMHLLIPGIKKAALSLDKDLLSGHDAMKAIMTTDTILKECCLRFHLGHSPVHISGIAKGSGMIHPNMATMISVITTDCNISSALLDAALKKINELTFNRVSVDGETSICDMVVIMSSCLSSHPAINDDQCSAFLTFQDALLAVCNDLSRKIAIDGEGATKLLNIEVLHANTAKDAYLIASSVAKSPLVKTMMFGEDANWGRIITAAGYSGANFDLEQCHILFNGYAVCQYGVAVPFDEKKVKTILSNKEITITIDMTTGNFSDHLLTCDLSYDYVKINGSYRS